MQLTASRKILPSARRNAGRLLRAFQRKQAIHFLHIGKTGGSAIKHVISSYSPRRELAVYLHSHGVRLSDVPNGEKVIFFLRDPATRFVSGFYSRQRQGQPRYYSPWSRNEAIAFSRFKTPDQLARDLYSGDTESRRLSRFAMENIEHVRDSYWKWFIDEEYFNSRRRDIFFVGFQETLPEDFAVLKTLLGLPDNAFLPEDDVLAHRNPKTLDTSLGPQALASLRKWYEKDYNFIALCRTICADQREGLPFTPTDAARRTPYR